MKPLNNLVATLLFGGVFFSGVSGISVNLPSAWQRQQSFNVATAGLVKISLPVETLDASRPALEDLRIFDDLSNEIPYLIERPVPVPKRIQAAKSFHVALNSDSTLITLETGFVEPIDTVTLSTPAIDFIKAVRVESSDDGDQWHIVAQGEPIFRQRYGASRLQISFPSCVSKWLRLTVDDQRSQPVPFIGAIIQAAAARPAPGVLDSATITERDENPGETRLALTLGAANLTIASVQLETAEPLFMRAASVAVPKISDDSVTEQTIGQGVVYRVAVGGQVPSENLSVPVENLVASRELILVISNGDSPPLPISAVRVERRPVYLIFNARHAGAYHLLTGNLQRNVPHYDLGALRLNLAELAVSPVTIPPLSDNPDYRAPEALSGLELAGARLDVSEWSFRKAVKISKAGAEQIELDLDVLARAQPGLADLRVLRGSNQVPYIIQRTSISRALTLSVTATNDAKNSRLSRWVIKLPKSKLPLTRLVCVATTPLFERRMSLYEEIADERGDAYRRDLAADSWMQTPQRQSKEFSLELGAVPQSDTLILETENGDNPPVKLEEFTAFYPATRILFKAKPDAEMFLYYGNERVPPPSYDLNLVAGQLLAAVRASASLSGEEQLKKQSWHEYQLSGRGGVFFWGILAVVVTGLLVVISKLLPKMAAPPNS
jgi:hypothetical protein